MKPIAEYEIEDIGVENCQYFQGRGTAFTRWDAVAVGVGENAADALANALDDLSQQDWDIGGVTDELPETPDVEGILGEEPGEDVYYHVAVYVKE